VSDETPPPPAQAPFRILPEVTEANEHFWRSGERGELAMLCCDACATWVHPPAPVCPGCLGMQLSPKALSGRARLVTFTVNHHSWIPGFDPPYVVAIVELVEQAGLRLTTNLVGVEPLRMQADPDAFIGMDVRVVFEARDDDIYLPLFEPVA